MYSVSFLYDLSLVAGEDYEALEDHPVRFVGVGPVCTDITIVRDFREEGVEEFLVRMEENPFEYPAATVRITDEGKYMSTIPRAHTFTNC